MKFKHVLLMIVHPFGIRMFMRHVNTDLELGPKQSKFNIVLATITDVARITAFISITIVLIRLWNKI